MSESDGGRIASSIAGPKEPSGMSPPRPKCTSVYLLLVLVLSPTAFTQQRPLPIGIFSGNLSSRHYGTFLVTMNIAQDSHGKLRGTASLAAKCISDATVEVVVSGTGVTIAGSDAAGDNITFKGQIDPTTSQLMLSYIVNGSASGRCETDDGWGSLNKR